MKKLLLSVLFLTIMRSSDLHAQCIPCLSGWASPECDAICGPKLLEESTRDFLLNKLKMSEDLTNKVLLARDARTAKSLEDYKGVLSNEEYSIMLGKIGRFNVELKQAVNTYQKKEIKRENYMQNILIKKEKLRNSKNNP